MGLSLNRWHCLYSLGTTKHSRKTEPVLVILMTSSDMVPGMVNMNIKTERNTILNLRKRNKNVYEGTARYCASNERPEKLGVLGKSRPVQTSPSILGHWQV